jgi:hypothetical protein
VGAKTGAGPWFALERIGAAAKAGRGGDGCDRIGPDSIVQSVSTATQRNSMTGASTFGGGLSVARGEPPNV